MDRLVPGMSAEEAARTPPPLVDDDVDAPAAPDVVLGDGRVVREVVVELEPPDNIAVAKIAVASASTRCVQMTVSPPLGISFEENTTSGEIFIAEIAPGSNADIVGTAKVGDVLRACSAMVPEMKYGQGGLLLGGNGRPGFRRVLYMVPNGEEYRADGVSFDQTLGAVVSNARAGDFDATLVFERRMTPSSN